MKTLSKNARRKWERYRLPELERIRQQAIDEQMQTPSLHRSLGRPRTETILKNMLARMRDEKP